MTLQEIRLKIRRVYATVFQLSGYNERQLKEKEDIIIKDIERLLEEQKELPIGIEEWINQGIKYGYSNHKNLTKDKEFLFKIGMLRQWLNEDRISDPSKMVSNEDLLKWFK